MASQCKVCQHSQREAIDVALRGATSLRDIAAHYDLSKDGLARHKAKHIADETTAKKRDKPRQTPPSHVRNEEPSRKPNGTIPAEIRPGTQAAFLAAFIELANESGACRAVQIDRATVRWWEEHDDDFSLRYQDAQAHVNDSLRGEMFRRGVKGVSEPLVSVGKLVRNDDGTPMTVQKYSDTLLMRLAAARMPEFREKQQVQINGDMQHSIMPAREDMVVLQALRDHFVNRPDVLHEIATVIAATVT